MLPLPEGQRGAAWERCKKECSIAKRGELDRKVLSLRHYKVLMAITLVASNV
jgi:hypothetical protein